jgi:hypothetical protein
MKNDSRHFAAAILCAALFAAATSRADEKFRLIDLDSHMNRDLTENTTVAGGTNSLAQLPTGEQTLAGVKFRVGPGMIQLGGRSVASYPEKVEGIVVDGTFKKLHLLHSTQYGRGKRGDRAFVDDGVQIGQYIVHYDDGSNEEIPIIYGEDVRDWFFSEGDKEPSRSKIAWKGDNEFAKKIGSRLRLYVSTWTNPKPDKRVLKIDYVSNKSETAAAPFCISMSVEEK